MSRPEPGSTAREANGSRSRTCAIQPRSSSIKEAALGVGASHQHPGPTFGYVVKGRIKWAVNGEPAKELGPGQSFFEPMGSVHSTSANASATEPAVISVVIVGKSGEPLSKPATAKSGD